MYVLINYISLSAAAGRDTGRRVIAKPNKGSIAKAPRNTNRV